MVKKPQRMHYTENYILNPQHPVTVILIGAGGNGSQMLSQLARIDHAIKKLGHPGLHVTMFDNDEVSDANIGRQLFSPADIGMNKAVVLITRINQFFGTSWKAMPKRYDKNTAQADLRGNFIISCVDSVETRKNIAELIKVDAAIRGGEPYRKNYYWMDLGNSQQAGQFILGTLRTIEQPKKSKTLDPVPTMETLFDKFPDFVKQKTKDTGPSCSLAEALHKQDLFVNSTLTQFAAGMIWKMFKFGKINYHGAFINLKTMDISPIYL